MKRLVAFMTILFVQPLHAQWTSYPSHGVPRTSSGAADLQAPAPRTPDGKVDLSGIWEPEKNRPCPPGGCFDMQIPQEFLNIGYSLKDGLPYQTWAAEARRQRMEQNGKDDPVSRCLPPSLIQLHTSPLLRKIVQTPELIVILSEFAVNFRQVFTDARPPIVNPLAPSYTGFSTGRWEGDTLVVQTNDSRTSCGLTETAARSPMQRRSRNVSGASIMDGSRLRSPSTIPKPTRRLGRSSSIRTSFLIPI